MKYSSTGINPVLGAALALSVCGAFALPLQAAPVSIDDYASYSQTNIVDDGQYTGTMLGGEADFWNETADQAEYAVDTVSEEELFVHFPQTSVLHVDYDGEDDDPALGFGLPNVDLTDGGTNDQIEVDVTQVSAPVEVTVTLYASATDYSHLTLTAEGNPGVLAFPFADLVDEGAGADPASVTAVRLTLSGGPGPLPLLITEFRANASTPPPPPGDTIPPEITRFLKEKQLNRARPRHNIRGIAIDNDEVVKVEVKDPRKFGWRDAKLRGKKVRFKYKTSRHKKWKNCFRFRAIDASGNLSPIEKVWARGLNPAGRFFRNSPATAVSRTGKTGVAEMAGATDMAEAADVADGSFRGSPPAPPRGPDTFIA